MSARVAACTHAHTHTHTQQRTRSTTLARMRTTMTEGYVGLLCMFVCSCVCGSAHKECASACRACACVRPCAFMSWVSVRTSDTRTSHTSPFTRAHTHAHTYTHARPFTRVHTRPNTHTHTRTRTHYPRTAEEAQGQQQRAAPQGSQEGPEMSSRLTQSALLESVHRRCRTHSLYTVVEHVSSGAHLYPVYGD